MLMMTMMMMHSTGKTPCINARESIVHGCGSAVVVRICQVGEFTMKKHPMMQLFRAIRKQREFIAVFGDLPKDTRIPCAEVVAGTRGPLYACLRLTHHHHPSSSSSSSSP